MSTFEHPDAAPGADASAEEPTTTDTQAVPLPPLPEVSAAEAAETAVIAPADLTPPAAAAAPSNDTVTPSDLEPPAPEAPPAPAALPPAFTEFASDAAATSAPAATAAVPAGAASPAPAAPRTRWAGIVWGLALAGIAAFAMWLLTDADRQAAATDWILNLSPAAAVAYAVLVLGGFALVAGVVGLVRRAQRAGERRRAASTLSV
ncbi:hypothetical protein [Microbacterium kyungheense]|uniref:Uncharacterized protein n=1 Tax=Microbacterium kyungheense TaxID=1263636 RepID=A0A543FK93_9MICO|nr:hypothetical protein [Microbacterium kyungheense]TQM34288.1 hypothetical protein FB391_0575 [Microbacterium kyungheense]